MPKQLEEIKAFSHGIISSPTTTDIPKEAATYSLNIEPNLKQGSLKGIMDSKILSTSGWRDKRYDKYTLTLKDHSSSFALSEYSYSFFLWKVYDLTYFVWFATNSANTSWPNTEQRLRQWNNLSNDIHNLTEHRIDISTASDEAGVTALIQSSLNSLGPSSDSYLYDNVATTWFTVTQDGTTTANDIIFTSNFLGSFGHIILDSDTNYHITNEFFTVTSSIFGTGYSFESGSVKWATLLNEGDTDTLLTINEFNQLIAHSNIYSTSSFTNIISDFVINDGLNNITSENRNNSLFIGLGNKKTTTSKWFGNIERNQLDRVLDGKYLEDMECFPPNNLIKNYDYDNVVVPLLHSGMNSTNSMVAGAASLYGGGSVGADFGGADVDAEDFSGDIYRSLNGWIMKCLKNASIAFESDGITAADDDSDFHWSSVKRGMILRVDIGDGGVDQSYSAYHAGTPADGTAVKELRNIKEIGYGDMGDATPATEGIELHDGDLFQVVAVPSGSADGHDSLSSNVSYGNSNTYPRLIYVGSLIGNETGHASTDAYYPAPAWAYSHYNDDPVLHRIALSEVRDSVFNSTAAQYTFSSEGATGTTIDASDFNSRITNIDLSEYIPAFGFKIGTISRCMSCDGIGGIGGRTGTLKTMTINSGAISGENVVLSTNSVAHSLMVGDWVTLSDLHADHNGTWQITAISDTTHFTVITGSTEASDLEGTATSQNRNYYAGHGKLWVSGNDKSHNQSLWLVDVLNWTGVDIDSPKISVINVPLNFGRIHKKLISHIPGEGLIEETYHDKGWVDSNWNPYPKDCFIGAICETYSHQPHLDDGASNDNGKGRWRVWIAYQKISKEDKFKNWELFLYNFRPIDINNNNEFTQSFMYDKTPPYQQCLSMSDGILEPGNPTIYYPRDKFFLQNHMTQKVKGGIYSDGDNDLSYGDPENFDISDGIGGFQGFLTGPWNDGAGMEDYTQIINAGAGDSTTEDNRLAGLHLLLKDEEHSKWDPPLNEGDFNLQFSRTGVHNGVLPGLNFMTVSKTWADLMNNDGEWWKMGFFQNPTLKDPAGYWHILEAPQSRDCGRGGEGFNSRRVFWLGANLGWLGDRDFQLERHCMIPFYNKWYWTGDGSTSEVSEDFGADKESGNISDTKVAHIVTFWGNLEGTFVKDGGSMITHIAIGCRPFWALNYLDPNMTIEKTRQLDVIDGMHLWHMHDSPVAFSPAGSDSVSGGTTTTWGGSEVQGRPSVATTHSGTADIEADFETDNSITATQGYSEYNQYRWGHDNNGTASISDDSAYSTSTNTWNTYDSYAGQDGYGHYNMVTTTWSAYEIGYKGYYSKPGTPDDGSGNVNRHGAKRLRMHNMYFGYTDLEHGVWNDCDANEGLALDKSETFAAGGEGAGYFTYYSNRSGVSSGGAIGGNQTDAAWGNKERGYYPNDYYDNGTASGNLATGDATNKYPAGNPWANRRIVHCWGTVQQGTPFRQRVSVSNYSRLTNPRCVFRKINGYTDYDEITEKTMEYKMLGVDNIPFYNDTFSIDSLTNGAIQYGQVDYLGDDKTKVTVLDIPSGRSGGLKAGNKSWENLYDRTARPYYQSTDGNAKVVYNNSKFIGKNLCHSLFHKDNTFDTYSPIIVGQNSDNTKTQISTWRRSAWADLSATLGDVDDIKSAFFNFDKLFNSGVTGNNVHAGLDNCGDSSVAGNLDALPNRYPTELIGSNAGVTDDGGSNSQDNTDAVSGSAGDAGAHVKTSTNEPIITSEIALETGETTSDEFREGDIIEYKFSFLYDGYQDSPLSRFSHIHDGSGTGKALPADIQGIDIDLKIGRASKLDLNKRVTDIILWRRNNNYDSYRFVKQLNLSELSDGNRDSEGNFLLHIEDRKAHESYEQLTGLSSVLSNTTVNFSISAQVNDFLFVANGFHSKMEDSKNLIFRSQPGKFSIFNWKDDFLAMPEKPLALASFGGKLYVFTREKLYRVNPDRFFVENVMNGIGIINQNCVVVTDYGMFFCDANNMYHHDGSQPNIISSTIAYNQDNPEWSTGYKRAVKKSLKEGYQPLVQYDGRHHCVYFIIQGYSEGVSSFVSTSSRAFSYSISSGRFDITEMPPAKAVTLGKDSDTLLFDGYQIYSYRRSDSIKKQWSWDSKEFDMGSLAVNKVWKSIKISGSPTINNLNGTENDDVKVYIDGIQKIMTIQNKNYSLSSTIAGFTANQNWDGNSAADDGAIYTLTAALPGKGETTQGTTNADSFILKGDSMPEFVFGTETAQDDPITEGEIATLKYISIGQYLAMEMTHSGNNRKILEIVKVTSVNFIWKDNGQISRVEIGCDRGQLGTIAYDFQTSLATDQQWRHASIRYVGPSLKFPRASKGKAMQIKFQNQEGEVNSISFVYRNKTLK